MSPRLRSDRNLHKYLDRLYGLDQLLLGQSLDAPIDNCLMQIGLSFEVFGPDAYHD